MTTQPPEIIRTDKTRVHCDGGGALGHPRVYYDLSKEGKVECGYCDRLFILKGGPADTAENTNGGDGASQGAA
ncbi:zinc-finger domain-containing protein [Yunchengibacter salinarum]|uniref:zinc-finger domain-containing protein n=1 Tax=Yunchengibacter salinarum TaxID=3133399 RepID=UPI0035B5D110